MNRFWAKVEKTDTCWIWTGALNNCGYGVLRSDSVMYCAHRFSYERNVGEIPDGLEIDHLCRNRACVNPEHMEVVTHAENMRRRVPAGTCVNGHDYTLENTIQRRDGSRRCRACERAKKAEYRALKLAARFESVAACRRMVPQPRRATVRKAAAMPEAHRAD